MPLLKKIRHGTGICLILFAPMKAFSVDLFGGQAPLLSGTQLDAPTTQAFLKRCDETNMFKIPNRQACDTTIQNAKLSQATFNYCNDRYKEGQLGPFLECISKASGRAYPTNYLEACKSARSTLGGDINICTEYLANTEASFDSEAFRFCIEHNQNKFEASKPCLNAVRDRQIDVQKLKRTCVDERSYGEAFDACVNRITDKAPASKECGSATPSRNAPRSLGSPAPGIH